MLEERLVEVEEAGEIGMPFRSEGDNHWRCSSCSSSGSCSNLDSVGVGSRLGKKMDARSASGISAHWEHWRS